MISLDGDASPWVRNPQILASESVPIIAESHFSPLYQKSWRPWVHFVPVKNDLSDLIDTIEWLQENDDKAKEIAMNGNSLFKKLYNWENMVKDEASVYIKYASLMKYTPEIPDKKHIYKRRI